MPRKLPANCYRRGDTIWGRFAVAGREYRGSLRTADPREAAIRLKAWRTKIEREHLGVESSQTFRAAVVRWEREILPAAVKPSVATRYLSSIAMLDPVFGHLRLDQISSRTISDYIGTRTSVASNATIRRDLTALSRLLAACVAWGWLADNPARSYDRSIIRERPAPLTIPTDAEVETVLGFVPPMMGAVLRLLAETGMREAEAVRLHRDAVDRERRQITLLHTKSGRPRTLRWATPGGDAGRVLDHHPIPLHGGFLFAPRDDGARPYAQFSADYSNAVRRLAAREQDAGRPFRRFRVHDLRHRFAIAWLKAGGDVYRLSRHLGHTSVKTTEIYLRWLTDEEVDAVMNVVARQA